MDHSEIVALRSALEIYHQAFRRGMVLAAREVLLSRADIQLCELVMNRLIDDVRSVASEGDVAVVHEWCRDASRELAADMIQDIDFVIFDNKSQLADDVRRYFSSPSMLKIQKSSSDDTLPDEERI